MKRKTLLTIVGCIAVAAALAYLGIVVFYEFQYPPLYDEMEAKLFVPGYLFLPLPVVGFAAGVLLQIFSVRSGKRKNR